MTHQNRRPSGGRAALRLMFSLGLLGGLSSSDLVGQDGGKDGDGPEVVFDHSACESGAEPSACHPKYTLVARDGDLIRILIRNTYPSHFAYSIQPIPIEPDTALRVEGLPPLPPPEDTLIVQRHDEAYGGYVVHVQPKSSRPDLPGRATLTIVARPAGVRVGFGGAFTLSGLTDPVFALKPLSSDIADAGTGDGSEGDGTTDGDGAGEGDDSTPRRFRFVEEPERRDEVDRGIASFVHAWDARFPYLALTFGLGLDEDVGNDYYFGLSGRLGKEVSLTGGLVVGSMATSPAGVDTSDVVTDPNLLGQLGERTAVRWFIGISYSFLGSGRDAVDKPFLGAASASAERSAQTGRAGRESREEESTDTDLRVVEREGHGAEGEPGEEVELTLKVVDEEGQPVPDIAVRWEVTFPSADTEEAGEVSPQAVDTDSLGIARTTVTLPDRPGQQVAVTATFPEGTGLDPETFNLSVRSPGDRSMTSRPPRAPVRRRGGA